jgi:hypothetical protein
MQAMPSFETERHCTLRDIEQIAGSAKKRSNLVKMPGTGGTCAPPFVLALHHRGVFDHAGEAGAINAE